MALSTRLGADDDWVGALVGHGGVRPLAANTDGKRVTAGHQRARPNEGLPERQLRPVMDTVYLRAGPAVARHSAAQQHSSVRHNNTARHDTVRHSTPLCGTALNQGRLLVVLVCINLKPPSSL